MPRLNPDRNPSYRRHRASGQAIVTLNGRDIYLGPYGTAASKAEYDRVVGEWRAAGRRLPASMQPTQDLSLSELIEAYWPFAKEYYAKDGHPTRELGHVKLAMKRLKAAYGRTPARAFGPLAFKAVRERLVDEGLSRTHVNTTMGRIKRLIAWGVENEIIPADVHHALAAVKGLRKGRTKAKEGRKVRPVPEPFVEAVKPLLSAELQAMIDLQLLTGARPGEVCQMRGMDIDTTGKVWTYRPGSHKTEHHDKEREIYLGPRAQEIVRDFLRPDLSAYLFSPSHAESARHAELAGNRCTRVQPSQLRRKERAATRARRGKRGRAPGACYTVTAYGKAIARACEELHPLPEHLARLPKVRGQKRESVQEWHQRIGPAGVAEVKAWRQEHHWHPHQLRHNAATRLRKEFGVEVARIILGHSSPLITEIYAEADRKAAADVMGRVG
ncbi:MAG: hypothetical protein AMXMBFR13_22330 [Phycisphaerae bacterium]